MRDPYQILGVPKGASDDEIKKAYRKLAKQFHPDVNEGDAAASQRFSEASTAYDLLSDKEKRTQFDRGEIDAEGKPTARGFNPFGGGGGGGPFRGGARGRPPGGGGFNAEDVFSEIFSGFGGPGRASGPVRGRDVSYTLKTSFIDAARGTKTRVTLAAGKTLDVNIPSGVTDGQQIRLKGQGEVSMGGGTAGDALITIEILPHALFTRDGANIRVDLPITIYEAVLGAKIRVPTLEGSVELAVPPNSSTGKVLRLKGKGIQLKGQSAPGDQFVTLRVMLPEHSGEDLREAAQRMADSEPYEVRGSSFSNKP